MPITAGTSGAGLRVRGFLLTLLFVRAAMGTQKAGLLRVHAPSKRVTFVRVLRAPYKNKNAWTPYTIARYRYGVTIVLEGAAASQLGFATKLTRLLCCLDAAHVTLSLCKVRCPLRDPLMLWGL